MLAYFATSGLTSPSPASPGFRSRSPGSCRGKTSDGSTKPEVNSSNAQGNEAARQSSSYSEVKSESERAQEKSTGRRGSLVPAPLPISSPTVGIGIVPSLGYI